MYKIFNSNALNRNQRFLRALILGTVSSVVLGIVYGLFSSTLRIEFSIVYLAIGYANAYVICNYGRGVQTKFSVLGAVLTFVSIFIGDMISRFGLGFFGAFNLWPTLLMMYLRSMLATNINSILGLLFRIGGIYIGYTYSRVV